MNKIADFFQKFTTKRNLLFVILSLCITLLAFFALRADQPIILEAIILLSGICASIICIKKGFAKKPQSSDFKKIKWGFFCLLLFATIFLAIFWFICFNYQKYTNTIFLVAQVCCIPFFGLGIYALFKVHKNNGKWLSIYILSLVLLFLFSICFSIVGDMSPIPNIEKYYFYAVLGVLGGIIGLCSAKWCCN